MMEFFESYLIWCGGIVLCMTVLGIILKQCFKDSETGATNVYHPNDVSEDLPPSYELSTICSRVTERSDVILEVDYFTDYIAYENARRWMEDLPSYEDAVLHLYQPN